jgi:hypothetical protein
MLGNTSPMKYHQSFVDGDPYQPTAESALTIKCRYTVRRREQTILYSNIGSVRIAKHAVCERMEQAAISRRPNIRPAVVHPNSRDRNSFVRVQLQVQCGPHFHSYFLSSTLCVISPFAVQLRLRIGHAIRGSIPSHCARCESMQFVSRLTLRTKQLEAESPRSAPVTV